jgi:molybdate transport system substrate-binding protein
MSPICIAVTAITFFPTHAATPEEIHIAVASNFTEAMKTIVRDFEAATPHQVVLSPGSTGKQYAQIRNGAPYHLFFAADAKRPARLEKDGHAIADTRFTYALGALVLWSARPDFIDAQGKILEGGSFRYLAMANPKLAPYGAAAKQVLQARGLWDPLQGRIAHGENIAQTYQFVASGNAELGFIAGSQLHRSQSEDTGSHWLVPSRFHDPIEQQAVLIKDTPAARAFMDFVQSDSARKVIQDFGYTLPNSLPPGKGDPQKSSHKTAECLSPAFIGNDKIDAKTS